MPGLVASSQRDVRYVSKLAQDIVNERAIVLCYCPCCLTNYASPYTITLALSKRQVAAVALEPAASSQRDVREQSRKVYYNGNIITIFRV
jgi:hypothetical protein